MTLWPIAFVTFKEGIRNRALYGITLVALLFIGATFFVATFIPREVDKVSVDMALSTISFTGLLVVLFVGINLMAKDLDKRTIYTVLSRPVSRSEYIIGKFFGMMLLVIVTIGVLSILTVTSLAVLKIISAGYFTRFSWKLVFLAIFFIVLSLALLTAVSFLFSSFTSSSFITMILTTIAYIIGQSLSSVKALVESPPQDIGFTVSPITVKMVQAAFYVFPNLSLFDIKLQAAHALPISGAYIGWTVFYGVAYSALAVAIAALAFRKKEFP